MVLPCLVVARLTMIKKNQGGDTYRGSSLGTRLRCGDQDLAILGRGQVVHDAHEQRGLCTRLLRLRHMHVHLVAVEVSVVWRAHALIEAERPARQRDCARFVTFYTCFYSMLNRCMGHEYPWTSPWGDAK